MNQEEGWIGNLVGGMIRRTVRTRFRTVYWRPLAPVPSGPILFAVNHHGWHDGYLMYHVVKALRKPSLDWIAEFDAFPLFAKVGGMPFPPGDSGRRTATIRQTIRRMNSEGRSLIFFPEMKLHPGPSVLELGRAVELLAREVPTATILPVAIHYALNIHERPEAWIQFGDRIEYGEGFLDRLRCAMMQNLESLRDDIKAQLPFEVLVSGTADVNERWDFRARFGKK